METTATLNYPVYKVSVRPTMARAAAANEPTVLLALPVKGALPPALPVPMGADGLIGEPVAPGPDPAPPDGEPVPVGMGAPVPVAKPVEPATPEELQSQVSIKVNSSGRQCLPDSCGLGARAVDVIKGGCIHDWIWRRS